MTTALFTHAACLEHDTGPGHPERARRLGVILEALNGPEFASLDRREAPRADRREIALAHDADYVAEILARVPERGHLSLDGDTLLSPGSGEAALRAAGAAIAAVDLVMSGAVQNAFCAVRPPGHHAERDMAMGFCLFNNVAVGARHARTNHGISRVAIVDFDLQHGNGTPHIFAGDSTVLHRQDTLAAGAAA